MKQTEYNRLKEKMMQLMGQPFNEMVRVGSMLCLGFGEKVVGKSAYKTADGHFEVREVPKSKYALHVDGFFRVIAQDELVLSRDDMYQPSNGIRDADFDEEIFRWDVRGNNRFDECNEELFDLTVQKLQVQSVSVSKVGDLAVTLSDGCVIEALIDSNGEDECWRFFETGNDEAKHIIVTGKGYREE